MESATRYWRAYSQGKNGDRLRYQACGRSGGRRRGKGREARWHLCTAAQSGQLVEEAAVQHRELSSEPCDDGRGGMEAQREAQEAGNMWVHTEIRVVVQQKPIHGSKAIILQLK